MWDHATYPSTFLTYLYTNSSLFPLNTNFDVESHRKRRHGAFLLHIPLDVLVDDVVVLKLVGAEHGDAVSAHLMGGFPIS